MYVLYQKHKKPWSESKNQKKKSGEKMNLSDTVFSENGLFIANAVFYVANFVVYFGIFKVNPDLITDYSYFMHFSLSLFLVYKFHPWRKSYILSKNDPGIIMSLALFIVVDTCLHYGIIKYIAATTKNELK